MKIIVTILSYFFIVVFLCNSNIQSQELKISGYQYISPIPGSKYIMPQNNIAIRHGDPIKVESLQNFNMHVSGSESGLIAGRIELSDDGRTIIFKPDEPYKLGEEVQVMVYEGLKTKTGIKFEQKEFSFFITSSIPDLPENYFLGKEFGNGIVQKKAVTGYNPNNISQAENNNLPEDFPLITINSSDDLSPEGFYFVAPFTTWGWYPDTTEGQGENEWLGESNVSIYPNPVADILTIKFHKNHSVINVKILDSQLKIVYNVEINGALSHTVNVKNWSAGFYHIQLHDRSGNNIVTYKIIKQ